MFHCTCNTNNPKKVSLSQSKFKVRIQNDTPNYITINTINLNNNTLTTYKIKPYIGFVYGANSPSNIQFNILKNNQHICTVVKTLKVDPETVLVSNILNEGTCTHYSLILKNDQDYPVNVSASQTREKLLPLTTLHPNSDTVISNPIQAPITVYASAIKNVSVVCRKRVNLGNPFDPPTVKVSEIISQENSGNCTLYYQEFI